MGETRLVIDGNNLGWMAFGIVPLTHEDKRVEVIYLGLNMLRGCLVEFEPKAMVVVWDGGRNADRIAIFPEYKRRKPLTEAEQRERLCFFNQLKELQKIVQLLGITQYRCEHQEADDVIFSLLDDRPTVIVSTDKDYYQLLTNEKYKVYNPVKKQFVTTSDVEQRFGVPIELFLDYRALVGDSSDNLPGVRNIGTKGAQLLVNGLFAGKDISSKDQRLYNKTLKIFQNRLGEYERMRTLMSFKRLDAGMLQKGKIDANTDCGDAFQEELISVLDSYGFDSLLNNFENFVRPFIKLKQEEARTSREMADDTAEQDQISQEK